MTARVLPTVPLGQTGMEITRVGFGAWAIGGADWAFGWGAQDDEESIEAIRYAVESGINWIDTAAVYGFGHSEELVSVALQDLPEADRPYLFTKCGLVWDPENRSLDPLRIGSPASIRREVEDSLRRLGVERIDLYQMHWPAEDGTPLDEYWQTLLDLRQEGKIRAAGLSNHDVDLVAAAHKLGRVDSLQPPFSAIHREVATTVLPWCAEHTAAVLAYSPMQSGLLTGTFSQERADALPADDWRSRSPDFTGSGLERNLALAQALEPVADRHDVEPGAVAVAWTLAWPGVTGAIVGARRAEQVDGWLPAAKLKLTPRDLSEIAAAIRRTGAGSGPLSPEG